MDKQAIADKGVNKGMLAMQAANAAKRAAREAAKAAMTPEQAVMVAQVVLSRKQRTDKRTAVHQQASISVAVYWRASIGWREGASEALTVTHVRIEAPSGAFRRVARAAKAMAASVRPSKAARMAGVLAVCREDALALLA